MLAARPHTWPPCRAQSVKNGVLGKSSQLRGSSARTTLGAMRDGRRAPCSDRFVFRFVHDLRFVLVEIETGVKLRLLRKKILQAGFVLKGPAQLGAVIGQGLLLPLDFLLFFLGAAIEAAEGVLDTRDRPQRVFGIEIGLVGFFAPDEEIRHAIFFPTARGSGSRSL